MFSLALTSVTQFVGPGPMHQKVTVSIPGQGTYPSILLGLLREAADRCFSLSLSLIRSLPSPSPFLSLKK